jgi:hypothetical protein
VMPKITSASDWTLPAERDMNPLEVEAGVIIRMA